MKIKCSYIIEKEFNVSKDIIADEIKELIFNYAFDNGFDELITDFNWEIIKDEI